MVIYAADSTCSGAGHVQSFGLNRLFLSNLLTKRSPGIFDLLRGSHTRGYSLSTEYTTLRLKGPLDTLKTEYTYLYQALDPVPVQMLSPEFFCFSHGPSSTEIS